MFPVLMLLEGISRLRQGSRMRILILKHSRPPDVTGPETGEVK